MVAAGDHIRIRVAFLKLRYLQTVCIYTDLLAQVIAAEVLGAIFNIEDSSCV